MLRETKTSQPRAGFTLVELMVVVAIIGVLASIAVPSYRKYITWARAQEAQSFLPVVRSKQIAYYQEFRSYVSTFPSFNPSTMPCGSPVAWSSTAAGWVDLGVTPPSSHVFFQYVTRATTSTPSTSSGSPDTCYGQVRPDLEYGTATGGDWFVVCARGDLIGSNCSSFPMRFGITGASGRGKVKTNVN